MSGAFEKDMARLATLLQEAGTKKGAALKRSVEAFLSAAAETFQRHGHPFSTENEDFATALCLAIEAVKKDESLTPVLRQRVIHDLAFGALSYGYKDAQGFIEVASLQCEHMTNLQVQSGLRRAYRVFADALDVPFGLDEGPPPGGGRKGRPR